MNGQQSAGASGSITIAAPPGASAASHGPVRLDFEQVRAVLQRAVEETERQLKQTERRIEQAIAEKAQRQQELRYLKKMLDVQPAGGPRSGVPDVGGRAVGVRLAGAGAPPEMKKGTRTGLGPGSQAGLYLLETARIRVGVNAERRLPGLHGRPDAEQRRAVDVEQDGRDALTEEAIALSCRGWKRSTVRDGVRWLLESGLLARTDEHTYRMTQAGWDFGPVAHLPLLEPNEAREPVGV